MSTVFPLRQHRTYSSESELMFLIDSPVVYHCHHFNLYLDQTIDDALGPRAGQALRIAAAHEFARPLILQATQRVNALTPAERIMVARNLFRAMGHGLLDLHVTAAGGTARGNHLHYGHTWREKYGAQVRRRHPADAVAAGFLAAATEVAYDMAPNSLSVSETNCIALRDDHCAFTVAPVVSAQSTTGTPVGRLEHESAAVATLAGEFEEKIATIASGLRDFTAGVAGDDHGLVQAFGVFVTMHLAGYYNRISYDALRSVEARAPQSVNDVETLLRESGHVCVFNTFGGILLSPEWDGMVGAPGADPADVVLGCVAIARALGFGHWYIHEYVPRRRLVLRATSTYEAGFYRTNYGTAPRPQEYFFQGAAMAIMQLAHRVDWKNKPALTQSFYDSLFRTEIPCKAQQTRSLQCGDPYSEVVVTAST